MRSIANRRLAIAAVLGSSVIGCSGSSGNNPPEVFVPAVEPAAKNDAPSPFEGGPSRGKVSTALTLLKTGDTFLAYVSAPQGDSFADVQDARVSFSYGSGSKWTPIEGCQAVFSCDVSGLADGAPLTIRASFTPEPGSAYSFSSAEHPMR